MKDEQSEITSASKEPPLNYFSYFTEVEDAFIRRRGKHLHLCPLDWDLIEVWKDRGIPLHVVLRGIETWFDFYERKRRRRSVNMLLYCLEEVEAQYAEWLESRVGAGSEQTGEEKAGVDAGTEDDGLPFPRTAILEHLRRGYSDLLAACEERKKTGEDDLSDALVRAALILAELEQDIAQAASPNAQKLEDSLTGLERMLSDSILSVVPSGQLDTLTSEVEGQLRPYRNHMDRAVYEQTKDNLLLKRLREQFAVPRLSLFYL